MKVFARRCVMGEHPSKNKEEQRRELNGIEYYIDI